MRARWVAAAAAAATATYAVARSRQGHGTPTPVVAGTVGVAAATMVDGARRPGTPDDRPVAEPDREPVSAPVSEPVVDPTPVISSAPEPRPEPGPELDSDDAQAASTTDDVPRSLVLGTDSTGHKMSDPRYTGDSIDPGPADDQPEPDDEPEPEDDPVATREALAGFYTGLVCMLFAPVLYFSATRWIFQADTASDLVPFVLLLLAVPAVLVALPRTRRFGLYMVLGLAVTGAVVVVSAVAAVWLIVETGL